MKKDTYCYPWYNVSDEQTLEVVNMCHLNYSKNKSKYKHLIFTEITMIETLYNCYKKSKKEIAELLHERERTIK